MWLAHYDFVYSHRSPRIRHYYSLFHRGAKRPKGDTPCPERSWKAASHGTALTPACGLQTRTVSPRLRETPPPTFTIYRKFAFCCCDFVSYKYRHKTERPNNAEQVWKPVALALCSCIQVCSGHAGRELSPHWAWVHSCSDSRLELLLLPSFFIAQTDTHTSLATASLLPGSSLSVTLPNTCLYGLTWNA